MNLLLKRGQLAMTMQLISTFKPVTRETMNGNLIQLVLNYLRKLVMRR